jgi:anti-sigma regulatory factor (Ser/Thr protein kinase)
LPNLEPVANVWLFTINNQVSEIRRVGEWLDEAFRQLELPSDLLFKFDLCAEEAVTNTISYAYPENGVHEITLRLLVSNLVVSLEIEDDGVAFNPLDTPQHVQPASLEEANIGGLGIALMQRLMDECTYVRKAGRNVLKMIASVPPSGVF